MPMFISVIFQQLYNIADSIIVGNFAVNGEKPEDFNSISEYLDWLENDCKADEPIVAALKTKDENEMMTAIYRIDIKYDYSGRHYIPQGPKK